ncbi:MAG TPA: (deoxy)nucleoside triphosphate pyrophosphohydrolase [Candidatus Eisenbacteria bacterium]
MAAGVIRRGDYVLIARRLPHAHLGGFWEFPGGTREEGESLEECLVREIQEELGLTVRVGMHALTVRQDYPDRALDLHFYLCTPVAGTPEARGCAEFRWVTVGELTGFEFPPADIPLIEQLQAVPGH